MVDLELMIHPGEILQEEFIAPYGLTASALAKKLGMPPNRMTGIVNGTRGISPETAILLGETFGTTAQFWINLQARYDFERAQATVSQKRVERAQTLHRELEHA